MDLLDGARHEVDTARGMAAVQCFSPAGEVRSLIVLGHGAGGGVQAPDLLAVRTAVVARGALVALLEQPYRVAGSRSPAPAGHLDEAWIAVCAALTRQLPDVPFVTGGRSSGARVACRTARTTGSRAVLALAFPVRPRSAPAQDRSPELAAAGVPVLCVNGDRDPFGVPAPTRRVQVVVVPGADHGLRRDLPAVAAAATTWLARRRLLAPRR